MVAAHRSDYLLAYAEGRLEGAGLAAMEAHLAACTACRQEAADLSSLVDALAAMPEALRRVPSGTRAHWPAVWARVQPNGTEGRLIPAAGRLAPRVTIYLSLMVVALTAAMAWPGGITAQPEGVTAGVAETPRAAAVTPGATVLIGAASSETAHPAAATAGLLAVPQGPVVVGTPVPREGS